MKEFIVCGKERAYIHDYNGHKHRQSVDFIRAKIALGATWSVEIEEIE